MASRVDRVSPYSMLMSELSDDTGRLCRGERATPGSPELYLQESQAEAAMSRNSNHAQACSMHMDLAPQMSQPGQES